MPVSFFINPEVVSVNENATAESITSLMIQKNLKEVVVLGQSGELLGVLSKRDLIKGTKDSYKHLLKKS
jgi:CBS domain-containing protein